jgi:GGDEF domain-containing protein
LVNILYGYDHGNSVLIQIGRHLREISMQKQNLQPFRLSDDRFLVVIKDEASLDHLLAICQELLCIKEDTNLVGSIAVSIGLVQSTGPSTMQHGY